MRRLSLAVLVLGMVFSISSALRAEDGATKADVKPVAATTVEEVDFEYPIVPTSIDEVDDPELRAAMRIYSPNYDMLPRGSQIHDYASVYRVTNDWQAPILSPTDKQILESGEQHMIYHTPLQAVGADNRTYPVLEQPQAEPTTQLIMTEEILQPR